MLLVLWTNRSLRFRQSWKECLTFIAGMARISSDALDAVREHLCIDAKSSAVTRFTGSMSLEEDIAD